MDVGQLLACRMNKTYVYSERERDKRETGSVVYFRLFLTNLHPPLGEKKGPPSKRQTCASLQHRNKKFYGGLIIVGVLVLASKTQQGNVDASHFLFNHRATRNLVL